MTTPLPRTTYGASPRTWAMWLVAVSPLLGLIGVALVDYEGYFRASFAAALQGSTGSAATQIGAAFGSIGVASFLGLLSTAAFVVFAAVDWSILRRRGLDRPFHWAWSFFVLVSGGGLVYPIGRTVVVRRRTGRGDPAPLVVFIVLSVLVVVVSIAKVVAAFAAVAPLLAQYSTAP